MDISQAQWCIPLDSATQGLSQVDHLIVGVGSQPDNIAKL
jgi:hypothetical protein